MTKKSKWDGKREGGRRRSAHIAVQVEENNEKDRDVVVVVMILE